jgi:5-(carboxyamino)imidazole ribonucleotide mutase
MIARRIPQVGIAMSSNEDLPRVEPAARFLRDLDIPFEMVALSPGYAPDEVRDYALGAAGRGHEVIIAAGGGTNALACMIAAYTLLPTVAIPLRIDCETAASKEFAALLSTLETPPGHPIATVGFDDAENAACLAAQILGVKDRRVRAKLEAHREEYRRAARLKSETVAAACAMLQTEESVPAFEPVAAVRAQVRVWRTAVTDAELEEAEALEAELAAELKAELASIRR